MKIICAKCNNAESIASPQNGQSIICKNCDTPIKVAICHNCSAVYSISFPDLKSERYTMKCRSCSTRFVVDFSGDYLLRKKILSSPILNGRDPKTEIDHASEKKFNPPEKKQLLHNNNDSIQIQNSVIPSNTDKCSRESHHPAGYDLNEFLSACGKFLTAKNFFIAAAGTIVLALLVRGISGITEIFSSYGISTESIAEVSTVAAALLGCAVIESVICKSVRDGGSGSTMNLAAYSMKAAAGTVAILIAFLAAVAGVTSIAGSIPVVGPVLFSLMFLPVYSAFILLIIIAIVGFWFFPAVSSATIGGYLSALKNLFSFTRKHNYRLIFIIPILSIIGMLLSWAVYLLNYYSIKLSILVFGGFISSEAAKIFSSIPAGMHRIFNVTYMGTDISRMKIFMQGLLLSHETAGIILGLILLLISVSMISILITSAAALSYQAYASLENGRDIDDRSKLRLLAILLMILGGIYLAKIIFR